MSLWTRYLIGAGGAHSPVRGAMHEHLEGTTYPFSYLVADVSGAIGVDRNTVCVAIARTGLVMLAPLPEDRWLALVDLPDAARAPETLDMRSLCEALELRLDTVPPLRDVRWCSLFHTHRRIAPRFGDGHRFLVGDAAHICSFFGGEGMNAGLQDAADIGWKLSLVVKGLGGTALLDAYEHERRCAAEQVLASADYARAEHYRMVQLAAANQPITAPPPDQPHPVTMTSMLDLSWCDSAIVGAFTGGLPPGRPGAGERFRDRTALRGILHHLIVFPGPRTNAREFDRFAHRWDRQVEVLDPRRLPAGTAERAALVDGGAVLVRPDGFIGFRCEVWDDEAVAALDAHLVRQLIPA